MPRDKVLYHGLRRPHRQRPAQAAEGSISRFLEPEDQATGQAQPGFGAEPVVEHNLAFGGSYVPGV